MRHGDVGGEEDTDGRSDNDLVIVEMWIERRLRFAAMTTGRGALRRPTSPYLFCLVSLLASVSHYVASRLATSTSEMHTYTAGSSVASAALLMMVPERRRHEPAPTAAAAAAACAAFIAVKYARISLDGLIFRFRPMIYALASRNLAAAALLALGDGGAAAVVSAGESTEGGTAAGDAGPAAAVRRSARLQQGSSARRRRRKEEADADEAARSDEAGRRRASPPSRQSAAAILGTFGCVLLALGDGWDGATAALLRDNALVIAASASLQVCHAFMGRHHPSLRADAWLSAALASGVAAAYGEVPRATAAMVAGSVFAVAGGLVGVLYCVVVIDANHASKAKYAQASAVSKVLALPIAACLMSEPVDLSRWRTNAGAALTVLAFVAR